MYTLNLVDIRDEILYPKFRVLHYVFVFYSSQDANWIGLIH
jgi:hypothetical protein